MTFWTVAKSNPAAAARYARTQEPVRTRLVNGAVAGQRAARADAAASPA